MTRDYKKNVNRKKSGTSSVLNSVMPFLTGLVIGLFVAFIVYLKEHQPPRQVAGEPEVVIDNKMEKTAVAESEDNEKAGLPEPQFDFYQILPNMEVNVSEWEADTKKTAEPLTEKDGVYVLQVGSFEQYEAADEVKANLALLGINADIQRVVINGKDVRHRVRVGPYKDLEKLQQARDRLLANGMDYMLLKLKVDDL